MSKWYVYILKCTDGRFYTGMTSDLKRRLAEHKRGKGGKFTRSFGVEDMIYSEETKTRAEAMQRELQIKRYPREKKLALIGGGS